MPVRWAAGLVAALVAAASGPPVAAASGPPVAARGPGGPLPPPPNGTVLAQFCGGDYSGKCGGGMGNWWSPSIAEAGDGTLVVAAEGKSHRSNGGHGTPTFFVLWRSTDRKCSRSLCVFFRGKPPKTRLHRRPVVRPGRAAAQRERGHRVRRWHARLLGQEQNPAPALHHRHQLALPPSLRRGEPVHPGLGRRGRGRQLDCCWASGGRGRGALSKLWASKFWAPAEARAPQRTPGRAPRAFSRAKAGSLADDRRLREPRGRHILRQRAGMVCWSAAAAAIPRGRECNR